MPNGVIGYHGLDLSLKGGKLATLSMQYEEEELNLISIILSNRVTQQDRILMSGVGMGFTMAWAVSILGVDRVVGYEADPWLARLVPDQVHVNRKPLDVRHGALAAESGIRLFQQRFPWAVSSLCDEELSNQLPTETAYDVPAYGVNEVIEKESITMLFLDVEGGEREIIPVLDTGKLRVLLVEIHSKQIGSQESEALVSKLDSAGFSEKMVVLGSDPCVWSLAYRR